MDGLLVIDKPQGLTSHDVVAIARRALGEKRIGHTGTLDPMATGVLPLACGVATRLVRFLTASDKDYDATIRFGLTTDSYDSTGQETHRTDARPSREAIEDALATLRGEYDQMPPAFSAKKVQGRRAYDLARRQEPVQLTAVPVRVDRAELTGFDGDRATVSVTCSAGFYVRSFAHTLGARVGTGACLDALRRTRSGATTLATAISIDALKDAAAASAIQLVPLRALLPTFTTLVVTPEGRARVAHGRHLDVAHLTPTSVVLPGHSGPAGSQEWVRLLDQDGNLIAMAVRAGWSTGSSADSRVDSSGSLHPSVVLI